MYQYYESDLFFLQDLYLVNISNSARHSTITSARLYQRDCATLFELNYVSRDRDVEYISPFKSIFVMPDTHGSKRNSSSFLQKSLLKLVDFWSNWKCAIKEKERLTNPTHFLSITMKNIVPERSPLTEIESLLGNTPNKDVIITKLSRYEDFLFEKFSAKYLLPTDPPPAQEYNHTQELPRKKAKNSIPPPSVVSNKVTLDGKDNYREKGGVERLNLLKSFEYQFIKKAFSKKSNLTNDGRRFYFRHVPKTLECYRGENHHNSDDVSFLAMYGEKFKTDGFKCLCL